MRTHVYFKVEAPLKFHIAKFAYEAAFGYRQCFFIHLSLFTIYELPETKEIYRINKIWMISNINCA